MKNYTKENLIGYIITGILFFFLSYVLLVNCSKAILKHDCLEEKYRSYSWAGYQPQEELAKECAPLKIFMKP